MEFQTIPVIYLLLFNTDINSTVFSYRVGSSIFSELNSLTSVK